MFPLTLFLLILSALNWNLSLGVPLHTSSLAKRVSNGRFTYYSAGLGACGKVNTDSDFIVALNIEQWDGGSHCFEQIEVSYKGKHAVATVMDQCPGCPYGALDLTPSLFSYLTDDDLGLGVIYGSWDFGGDGPPDPPTTTKRHTTSTLQATTTTRPSTTTTLTTTSSTPSPTASSETGTTQSELLLELYDQLALMIVSAVDL